MLDIKRLDHFGLVAGTIKDLNLIEVIDNHFENNDQENITTGEAIAGMIINGLGFTQLPMTLTPNFFETKPVDILFRNGVEASHFNRFKLILGGDAGTFKWVGTLVLLLLYSSRNPYFFNCIPLPHFLNNTGLKKLSFSTLYTAPPLQLHSKL